jgi:hypothetical protein
MMFRAIFTFPQRRVAASLAIVWSLLAFTIARADATMVSESCDQAAGPITADDSPQKSYFADLLKRGMSAPLSDFLKLWYPDRKGISADQNPYFFKCENGPYGILMPTETTNGIPSLTPECSPDVLYSWALEDRFEAIKKAMPDGETWSGPIFPWPNMLYTTLAPSATFMYGSIQVRVKIKPGTRFGYSSSTLNQIQFDNTNYVEYHFNDPSVVESWSYGTPEQYDEIVRDYLRIHSDKRAILYGAFGAGTSDISVMSNFNTPWDDHPAGDDVFQQNLLNLIRMILNGEGRIQYSKGACRNRLNEFSTPKPTYFDPFTPAS